MTTHTWTAPIFFDLDSVESIAEEEKAVTLDYTPPVILPEEIELETNALLLAHEPDLEESGIRNQESGKETASPDLRSLIPDPRSPSLTLWLLISLGSLFTFMVIADAIQFTVTQYHHSIFLGSLFLILIISLVSAASMMAWRAYQNILTLRTVSALQAEGKQLISANGHGDATRYINQIAQFYIHRPDIKSRLDRFYAILNDSHHDQDVCALFSKEVMSEIDQQAYAIVVQRSKETALMVMFSPVPLLDVILTLWRNIKMIRDIATLYGGRPQFLGSIALVTSVVQNLIYADVSEIVADSVAEIFGSSMISVMSAGAAQGLGSGVMTARVGLQAMQSCRPLPFAEEEKPRLKEIRWEIVSSIKKLFNTKKTEEKIEK